MKRATLLKSVLVLGVIGALLALAVLPGRAQGGITVTGADSTRNVSPAASSTLNSVLSAVGPRVRAEFSESMRLTPLTNVPGTFGSLLSSVGPRVRAEFSESMRLTPLTNVPGALGSLLSGVGARVRYEFAQSSRAAALSYPSAFIVDTAPPVVSGLGAAPINAGQSATITWTTNEFATSAVFYGAQSGNLNQSVSSALYNKTHSLTLAGLTPNSTYYYKVRNVDLKGNVTESAQNSFVATQTRYLYLPLVRR